MNRVVIYSFYDKDGQVDHYVYYMLKALQAIAGRIVFIANGALLLEHQNKLIDMGIEPVVRNNEGFDAWAYRAGIRLIGYDALKDYDDLVLTNNSVFGPTNSLSELFLTMEDDSRDKPDLWGITAHKESHASIYATKNRYGYLPAYIPMYFISIRKSLLSSDDFKDYWEKLPLMEEYWDAVYLHEAVFTKHFADLGYKWDSYVHSDKLEELCDNPMIFYPLELIRDYKCPVIKRRAFFHEYDDTLVKTIGKGAVVLQDYLETTKVYDMDMIWENLLRTRDYNELFNQLHLNYTLSLKLSDSENLVKVREHLKTNRAAAIIHVYFEDLLEETSTYIDNIPKEVDIYITTSKPEIKEYFEKRKNAPTVHMIQNRGRDVSAILVAMKDVVCSGKYEYIFFGHDKKASQNDGALGEGFSYKCWENTLGSETFIYNILEKFISNSRLGILCPPEPNHGAYSPSVGNAWGAKDNFELTCKLAKELELTVPVSWDSQPIAPYGSFFWFRAKALEGLYKKNWSYEDFPPEPLPEDGTISHAIERIRPYVAQQAGYYTAYVMNDEYARIEYTNLHFYLAQIQKTCADNGIRYMHEHLITYFKEHVNTQE